MIAAFLVHTPARLSPPFDHEPITYWEKVGATRWGSYTTRVAGETIREALRLARRDLPAMEVGCEGGRWSRLLRDEGWEVVCTDVDPQALELCQRRIPEATCILVGRNDSSLPCKPHTLSLLLCVEVFPVIQTDWFSRAADQALVSGGFLVGVALNRWSLRGLFVSLTERRREQGETSTVRHYQLPYAPWRRRLEHDGFSIVYERGYCWFPFRRDSNSKFVPLAAFLEEVLWLSRLYFFSPWVAFIARKR